MTDLNEKLKTISKSPGVYLFKDKNKKVIYVGKARILRNRVRSYFQSSKIGDAKTQRLISKIIDFETIVTDSEMEALILEANMIKEYKPRYNVNLKDDKSFPYIRVTYEKFPRIFPTRKIKKDGSKYFGPYTDVSTMRELLKVAKRIFPIRTCNLDLTEKNITAGKFKVCLNYHITKCMGPCEGLINEKEYSEIVKYVIDFINGRDNTVVEELQNKMDRLSHNYQFEKAAAVRDQIKSIKDFIYRQKVITPESIDRDLFVAYAEDDDACAVIFKIREGRIVGRQHYFMTGVEGETLDRIIGHLLIRYYQHADFIPGEIYLPLRLEENENIEKWFFERLNSKVKISCPQRGEKAKLMRMAFQNAKLLLQELKLQRFKDKDFIPHSLKALQRDLRLSRPPKRIEAFDISNIQGTDPTASLVTFINGQANKNEYRHFKIRTKSTPDDFAMMNEVIERRYSRQLKENQTLPDLIMVDGGKGQLSAALKVLEKLNIKEQPIIGLAKRLDEVFVPGASDAQNIPRTSSGLRLLQRIRDESHRFAVEYHRKLRSKRSTHSELDEIIGIGESRKKKLIHHFGSLKKLKAASLEEIKGVKGIPESLAERIWKKFGE
ncbi:excinuclease ABC subunit C [candidate division KSB1 bacterium]|nr:excinuclease ABC subunit C [candidate division KSB1 bacterium]MBL7095181.1 excinuclease ABC subunit C [candidate division KSB1 bacterium]